MKMAISPNKERVLKNRRKKASKGKTLRVSDAVFAHLNKRRNGRSWDKMLRSAFGLRDRRGNAQPLIEGWIEVNTGTFYLKKNEAYGAAVMEAARAGLKVIKQPIKLREVRW